MTWFIFNITLFSILFIYLASLKDGSGLVVLHRYLPRQKEAKSLYREVILLSSQILKGDKKIELTKYKFFTALIDTLIISYQKLGLNIHEFLPGLKRALINDMRFEKKIHSELLGGIFQMLVTQLMGAFFVFSLRYQVDIRIELSDLVLPIFIQLAGYIVFLVLFFKVKISRFEPVESYLKAFYSLNVYLTTRFPVNKINEKINFDSLCSSKDLQIYKIRAADFLAQIKNSGSLGEDDVEMTIEELWFLQEYRFESFLKHLAAIKLFVLIFFFLSSFMLVILKVMSSFSL